LTVRRLVLLTVGALLALTAIAYAVEDTVTYTASGSHKGKPSKKKPANFTYTGTLHVDTNPPGQQPDVAPRSDVYFDKGIKLNAALFPSCTKTDIENNSNTLPAKCQKAVVGTGTAKAIAGQPGSAPAVTEGLDVKAVNGPKGKTLFLVVHSAPDAPVTLPDRAIPGTVVRASGLYGYYVRFDVPPDLQNQLGLDVSLTDFKVTVSGKPRTFKVKGKKVSVSYLQLTACPGKQHAKAIVYFKDSANGGAQKTMTSEGVGKC
jgi:hypothetical protein